MTMQAPPVGPCLASRQAAEAAMPQEPSSPLPCSITDARTADKAVALKQSWRHVSTGELDCLLEKHESSRQPCFRDVDVFAFQDDSGTEAEREDDERGAAGPSHSVVTLRCHWTGGWVDDAGCMRMRAPGVNSLPASALQQCGW
jgi:hypothetical protein